MWRYRGRFCQLELFIGPLFIRPAAGCSAGSSRHRTLPAAARARIGRPAPSRRGRVLAALGMVMQQSLHLGHALANFPDRITAHRTPHPPASRT